MSRKRLPSLAYLWGRCEGWAKIGVCRSGREIGDWRLEIGDSGLTGWKKMQTRLGGAGERGGVT
jgi:hypothetical protein